MSVDHLLARSALYQPAKEAVLDARGSLTYGALDALASRFARYLQSRSIGKGDRIALLVPNCIEFIAAFFAISRAGAVLVPLNPGYTDPEFRHALRDSGARLAICRSDLAERVEAMRAELSDLDLVLAIEDAHSVQDLVAGFSAAPLNLGIGWNEPQAILYTSGTTGHPKGAILSHRTRIFNTLSGQIGYETTRLTRASCPAPLFHSGGMILGLVNVLAAGGTLLLPDDASVDGAIHALSHQDANMILSVPTVIHRMIQSDDFHRAAAGRSFAVIHGAAPISEPDVERMLAELPDCRPFHGYGSTEATQLTVLSPDEYRQFPRATGRALPGIDVRVVDTEGQEVEPGVVGEVVTSGPHVFDGYLNDPEKTSEAIHDGFHWTGDLATIDERGLISIVGRRTDMIISGGFNVYSSEVEQVLQTHPAVDEAAVFGLPDEEWGEQVAAAVILKGGMNCSAEELVRTCRNSLISYKKPRHIFFVETMPRTPVGKVQKHKLAEKFAEF
ncbi:MAG: class I adenylate-forming enzyme family protein [Rhodospirillales bacterium]|nr:class I adenylate-forming enzyme family protein [Rhodospirillales bacterium]